jgi:hypothetical protein
VLASDAFFQVVLLGSFFRDWLIFIGLEFGALHNKSIFINFFDFVEYSQI